VYIVVQSTQQVIDLRKKTFDASDLRRVNAPDGRFMHAELRIDDPVVMIAEASDNYFRTGSMFMYGMQLRLTGRRWTPMALRSRNQYGKKVIRIGGGGFKDPSGNTWWIAAQEA
jgi:PhnB protein